MAFTKIQLEIMAEMMNEFADRLSNKICDEVELEYSEENLLFCDEVNQFDEGMPSDELVSLCVDENKTKITISGASVAYYLAHLANEELERQKWQMVSHTAVSH